MGRYDTVITPTSESPRYVRTLLLKKHLYEEKARIERTLNNIFIPAGTMVSIEFFALFIDEFIIYSQTSISTDIIPEFW